MNPPFSDLPPPDPALAAPLVKACRSLAEKFVDNLHERIVASLLESLTALQSEDSVTPDPLVAQLAVIRDSSDRLGEAFRERFLQLYAAAVVAPERGISPEKSGAVPMGGESRLSLVDDTQLEEWLAMDNLIAKIHDRWSDDLSGLKSRFRHILPDLRINKYRLPLGPDKFCHAFHDALESIETDVHTRLYCYGLLDRALSSEIGGFYSQVNHFLIGKGVLPGLVIDERPREAPARAARRGGAPDYGAGDGPAGGPVRGYDEPGGAGYGQANGGQGGSGLGGGGGRGGGGGGWGGDGPAYAGPQSPDGHRSMPIREQMFRAMQNLLNMQLGTTGEGPDVGPSARGSAEMPVTPVLLDTLSALQHDDTLIEHTGELIRGGLRHYVHGRFGGMSGGEAGARISPLDDETIDVISMIFDYILDDRTLPDFMKALIGRLQIPVLKVALIDREFFSRKSHPARQLLNELAQAGAVWRDESEASKDRLYTAMEGIVRRVLNEFQDDIAIFEVLLAELRAFLEDEARRFAAAQQKLLEAARQAGEDEEIKARVLGEIGSRLRGQEVPEDIREFLLGPWRAYITALAMAKSDETAALALIDDLVWSLTPKRSAEDRKRLTGMLPALLSVLGAGLRHIDCPQADVDALVRSLEDYHFQSLKPAPRTGGQQDVSGKEGQDPAPQAPVDDIDRLVAELGAGLDDLGDMDWEGMSSFDDIIERKSIEGDGSFERMIAEMGMDGRDEGPRVEDEFTTLVRELAVGTWIELGDATGRVSRVRLAWKGDDHTPFSFVNRQYKVVAERPFYELADEFRTGAAAIIENVALFDRAVDGVIAGIMKLSGSQGA